VLLRTNCRTLEPCATAPPNVGRGRESGAVARGNGAASVGDAAGNAGMTVGKIVSGAGVGAIVASAGAEVVATAEGSSVSRTTNRRPDVVADQNQHQQRQHGKRDRSQNPAAFW